MHTRFRIGKTLQEFHHNSKNQHKFQKDTRIYSRVQNNIHVQHITYPLHLHRCPNTHLVGRYKEENFFYIFFSCSPVISHLFLPSKWSVTQHAQLEQLQPSMQIGPLFFSFACWATYNRGLKLSPTPARAPSTPRAPPARRPRLARVAPPPTPRPRVAPPPAPRLRPPPPLLSAATPAAAAGASPSGGRVPLRRPRSLVQKLRLRPASSRGRADVCSRSALALAMEMNGHW